MKNKINSKFLFCLMGIILFISYLYIGDLYYLETESKTIITISKVPQFQKVIFWACDIKGEEINNKYVQSGDVLYKFYLKGNYYTGSLVYILFIGSIYLFMMTIFYIFPKKMMLCKKYSLYKYVVLIFFNLFFGYAFIYYLSQGDILFSSGTEVSFMKFNHPLLIKRYIYECNHEDGRHDEFLKMIVRQSGTGEGDGVGTQSIFDLILLFNIYFIIRWFYIIKGKILKISSHFGRIST